METDELFFEISDGNNQVKVIPTNFIYPDAELEFDSYWLKSDVIVKAGTFSGSYEADFMSVDFAKFKNELEYLYNHLDSTATFEGLERYLKIILKGDGLGHLEGFCQASDKPGWMPNDLEFYLSIDQTYIPSLIRQLENIILKFPVIARP